MLRRIALTGVLLACCNVWASEMPVCEGSVLERRLGLLELGKLADDFVAKHNALPDLCQQSVLGVSDSIPARISSTVVCGSSKENAIYYSCELSNQFNEATRESIQVVETCRYSLSDQSLSCENRSVVTTFD